MKTFMERATGLTWGWLGVDSKRLENQLSCRSLRIDLSWGSVIPLLGDGVVDFGVDQLGGDRIRHGDDSAGL